MGLRSVQESCHPVGSNVHGGTRVVHISKDIAWLAMASIFESFFAPGGSAKRSAFIFCGDINVGRLTPRVYN